MNKIQMFVDAVKLVISREFPDLAGPYHYPAKAKVLRMRGAAADLMMLDAAGGQSEHPPLPAVPVPDGMELRAGDVVRIGFYYNDPAQAYIDAKA